MTCPTPSSKCAADQVADCAITVRVPGEPRGKGRHRTQALARGRVKTYPDPATERAEREVLDAWRATGARRIEGPVGAIVVGVMGRPLNHVRKDGTLTAAGQRVCWPTRKPDIDNILKLVLDALAKHAFGDDATVQNAYVSKRWAMPGEDPCTLVVLSPHPRTP